MKQTIPLLLAFLAVATAHGQALTRHPYLQNLTPESVELLWRTDMATASVVEITEEGAAPRVYLTNSPTTAHHVRVPGLKPDGFHAYRVGYLADPAAPGSEPVWLIEEPVRFQAMPPLGSTGPISFMLYGDHRNNPAAHKSVVDAAVRLAAERGLPRFVVDTGDLTGDGEATPDPYDNEYFGPAVGMMKQACYFTVIGNHECPRRHPRIPLRYVQNFSMPIENSGTPYFYSFAVGDMFFLMMDGYTSDYTEGSKQWHWARRELKRAKQTWKFVAIHYPPFIDRVAPSVALGSEDVRKHLVPLFEEFGVSMVMSGDSHFYQRSEVNGIQYVCSAGGGAPLYDPGDSQPYVRKSWKGFHYTWITVEGRDLKLEVFDVENNLVETMTMEPRSPRVVPEPELNHTPRFPAEGTKPLATLIVEARNAEGQTTTAPNYAETGDMMASTAKSKAPGLVGTGSRFTDNVITDARVTFQPPIAQAGQWLLSATVPAVGSADAARTLFEVTQADGTVIRGRVPLTNAEAGDRWHPIGLFNLNASSTITFIEVEDQANRLYVDGLKLDLYEPARP